MRRWIMVVDDDTDIHYIYHKVFEKLGFSDNIKYFGDGKEALEFLYHSSGEVKMIISDINMPVMDGLQLRSAINEDPSLDCSSIPFVYISTSTQNREVKAAYDLMVQGFFQKGLTMREIERSVRIVLERWGTCRLPELSDCCV